MAWRHMGDKSFSEPMLTQFTDAYIRGTIGRWVDILFTFFQLYKENIILCEVYHML